MAKKQRSWFEMKAAADKTAEIFIYGSIGKSWYDDDAVTAKKFVDDLKALGDVNKITLRINSPGGVVYDGLAIHNALKSHKAEVVAVIDGLAASMASFIAMAADKVQMPKNSFMLIHKASGMAWGNHEEMDKLSADLKRIDKVAAQAYAKRSGQSEEEVASLMGEDRLMDATEAVKLGYADELTEEVEIAASYDMRLLPKASREQFEEFLKSSSKSDDPPSEDEDDEEEDDDPDAAPPPNKKGSKAKGKGERVVSLDAARAQGHKQAREYALEVNDLCKLAGYPEMAADFIREGKAIAQVRSALVRKKAEGGGEEVDGHHHNTTGMQPQRSKVAKGNGGSWDKIVEGLNAKAPTGAR